MSKPGQAAASDPLSGKPVAFGPFTLFPSPRRLYRGEERVRLGGRAMNLLIGLLAHRGEVVPRKKLEQLVWPNTHVDGGNLRVQVCLLRRALGDDTCEPRYILTNAGEGYMFIGTVASPGPEVVRGN